MGVVKTVRCMLDLLGRFYFGFDAINYGPAGRRPHQKSGSVAQDVFDLNKKTTLRSLCDLTGHRKRTASGL